MRRLKLRAYHKRWKMMLPVNTIDFVNNHITVSITAREKIEGKVYEVTTDKEWCDDLIGEDIILLQFTGLLDQNKEEIYEGDIIQFKLDDDEPKHYQIGIVEWCNSCCLGFRVQYRDWGNNERLSRCEKIKVIGNIYDNPELLNKNDTR